MAPPTLRPLLGQISRQGKGLAWLWGLVLLLQHQEGRGGVGTEAFSISGQMAARTVPSPFLGRLSAISPAFMTHDKQDKLANARMDFRQSNTKLYMSGGGGFKTREEYESFLKKEGALPKGFRTGTSWISFIPVEANIPSRMNVTLIVLDEPTDKFAAVFTKNAFPGSPVILGRKRLQGKAIQAVVVNNKVSNVCPGGGSGVEDHDLVCEEVAKLLKLPGKETVFPGSTGVIGWRLPYKAIIEALPSVVSNLQTDNCFSAAKAICTTDRYPKVASVEVAGGRIVGFAKGAGMIEPNMATMLVYIMTDLDIPRETLRKLLPEVVAESFNCISVDSDESTSDTVLLVSSAKVPLESSKIGEVKSALLDVCKRMAEDIVRNGEGCNHVLELKVSNAPSKEMARNLGRAVVNSPLFKCAIAGNDPNVGRFLAAVGKYIGNNDIKIPLDKCRLLMGGETIFADGVFQLSPKKEEYLVKHMKEALIITQPMTLTGITKVPFPPHYNTVKLEVDLAQPQGETITVFGSDLTYDYVTENADYRS